MENGWISAILLSCVFLIIKIKCDIITEVTNHMLSIQISLVTTCICMQMMKQNAHGQNPHTLGNQLCCVMFVICQATA